MTGAVVQAVLERLGHVVTVRQGPHEEIFPLLGAGEVDLMAAAWLPEGHRAYWERYGRDAREVARLYNGARFFWGVPDYVPQDMVASIDDLARPEVAARMIKVIQGIGDGATISQVSRKAIADYGLGNAGYVFRPGTQVEWIAAYREAARNREWFLFPTWAPQYLNREGTIRPLQDPKGVLGTANRASLVAPNANWLALPARTRSVLSRVQLGLDAVTEMDWMVNAQSMTPSPAAATWIAAHPDVVAIWFAD